ncbi:MAG: hypothetical protein H7328_02125 [Bdellovibrio sp.]|nr:hypothetical protein [Bdellovibrio sp.]
MFISLTNCTIYRSPDRKDFESESSQFRTQNLVSIGCSGQTMRLQASATRLVTILPNNQTNESEFLWEYRIQDKSYFESDNFKGAYCVFENN